MGASVPPIQYISMSGYPLTALELKPDSLKDLPKPPPQTQYFHGLDEPMPWEKENRRDM